jgi:thiol-disulfide isomerase/thioredoxin
MKLLTALALIILSVASQLTAQSYQGLDAVKLVNAVNGDSTVLDFRSSGPLVVVIFTSNYCPYSRKYEERINQLYLEFSQRNVQFILVNPNQGPDDSLEEMKKKASELNYQLPYLKDHNQVLTGIMNANRTPEAFLLRPEESGFVLVYRGAIDDNPQTADDVENSFLKTAIQQALAGKPIAEPEVRVTGCIIKK